MTLEIILASESPARLELLKQIGIFPDKILPAAIDESQIKGENPRSLALRLAYEKASKIAALNDDAVIIGSDTVPVCRGQVLKKASNVQDVKDLIAKLSGRRHQLYTGVCIIKKTNGEVKIVKKLVKTILKFRLISKKEIVYYASLGEGEGKAGGYTLTGYAESFVSHIQGSFSNVIGLPLCETMSILNSFGIK
mgnify:CR=1 FL=1